MDKSTYFLENFQICVRFHVLTGWCKFALQHQRRQLRLIVRY